MDTKPNITHHWFNFAMLVVQLEDELTQQTLLLSSKEAKELRNYLNQLDDPQLEENDTDTGNRLAASQKALTIYNAHSLPYVNREQYEAAKGAGLISGHFDFELIQRIKDETGSVVERNEIGTI